MEEWYYVWNTESDDWVCEHAPQNAYRVYAADGHTVCDFYDSDKRIVSSTNYYLDTEGRLTQEQYSQGGGMTYEYLPGTDYLQESVRTDADGTRHVCHYYYSLHNYVEPTGIDNAQSSGRADNVWYDLQGRRITAPTAHGIYIVNGKKVMR